MSYPQLDEPLLDRVLNISIEAAARILEVYAAPFDVVSKDDKSPLTDADLASHRHIVASLEALTPQYPVLSEESADIPFDTRRSWSTYWLVDPLDGTKEFVNRNGEFTVNIALIHDHVPVLGVVWVPAQSYGYAAAEGVGAFRCEGASTRSAIQVRQVAPGAIVAAGSRSHRDPETSRFMDRLEPTDVLSMGSSLKICLVAEGRVDIYPRFGPTSEWDTAAAQCVVEQAGGRLTGIELQQLRYNTKESLLNPHFLVFGDNEIDWKQYMDEAS